MARRTYISSRRRRSSLAREQFGTFQADVFQRDATAQLAQVDQEWFTRTATQDLDTFLQEAESTLSRGEQFERAEEAAEQEDGGFLGGVGSLLSTALDVLARPAQAISGAFLGAQSGIGAWEGAKIGFGGTPEERENYNFATWLERGGMGSIGGSREVIGFIMDAVADPLNLFAFSWVRQGARALAYTPFELGAKKAAARYTKVGQLGESLIRGRLGLEKALSSFTPRIGMTTAGRLKVTAKEFRRKARRLGGSEDDRKVRAGLLEAADAIEGTGNWQGVEFYNFETGRATSGGLEEMARQSRNAQVASTQHAFRSLNNGMTKFFKDEFIEEGLTGRAAWAAAKKKQKAFVTKVRDNPDLNTTLAEVLYRAKSFQGGAIGGLAAKEEFAAAKETLWAIKRGDGMSLEKLLSHIDDLVLLGGKPRVFGASVRGEARRSVKLPALEIAYQKNVKELHELGLENFVRYIDYEYGLVAKQADRINGAIETMTTGGIAEQLLDVFPRQSMYLRTMVPSKKEFSRFIEKNSAMGGLFKNRHPKSRKLNTNLSLQELVRQGMDLDVFATVAFDLAETRASAIAYQMFDTDLLRGLGFRAFNKVALSRSLQTALRHIQKFAIEGDPALTSPEILSGSREVIDAHVRSVVKGDETLHWRAGRASELFDQVHEGTVSVSEATSELLRRRGAREAPSERYAAPGRRLPPPEPFIHESLDPRLAGGSVGKRGGQGGIKKRNELIERVRTLFESAPQPGETAARYGDATHGLVHNIQKSGAAAKEVHNIDAVGLIDSDSWRGMSGVVDDAVQEGIEKEGAKNTITRSGKRAPDFVIAPTEVIKAYRVSSDPAAFSTLMKTADALHGLWKPIVTVLPANLSYFTRNLAGLVFLGAVAGDMRPSMMIKWNSRAARIQAGHAFDDLPESITKMDLGDLSSFPNETARRQWITEQADEHLKLSFSYSNEALEIMGRRALGKTLSDDPVEAANQIVRWADTNPSFTRSPSSNAVQQSFKAETLQEMMELRGVVGSAGVREMTRIEAVTGEEWLSRVGRRMARFTAKVRGEKPTDAVLSREAMKVMLDEYGKGPLRRNFGWNPIRWGSTVAQAMDNNFKIGGFLYRIFDKGDTLDEAAAWVRKVYFNYDEVGEWTKQAATVFPFARWSRLNIPRMVEVMTKPRAWYKIDKLAMGPLANRTEDESVQFEASTLPDWILEKHHVVLGRREDGSTSVLYGLGLPIEDLNKLFTVSPGVTLENLVTESSPFLRLPFEGWVFDQSVFTGEAISDPSYRNYYRRAYSITENLPGLREALGVERQERNGRVTYRSNNPVAMYWFASLVGRPFGSVSKVKEIGEAVDSGNAVLRAIDFATGLKIRNVFPPPREDVPLAERALTDPQLSALLDQYYSIPIYGPEYMTSTESAQAFIGYSQARQLANNLRAYAEASESPLSEAEAMEYGLSRLEEMYPYGKRAELARRVWTEQIPQRGKKARTEFARKNPWLRIAMQGLTPDQIAWMIGIIDHRNIPRFLRS